MEEGGKLLIGAGGYPRGTVQIAAIYIRSFLTKSRYCMYEYVYTFRNWISGIFIKRLFPPSGCFKLGLLSKCISNYQLLPFRKDKKMNSLCFYDIWYSGYPNKASKQTPYISIHKMYLVVTHTISNSLLEELMTNSLTVWAYTCLLYI